MSEHQSIVAVYETSQAANAARSALVSAGISDADISVRNKTDVADAQTTEPTWWEKLFGSNYETIPEPHRQNYYDRVEKGQTLLTVRAIDSAGEFERVSQIIEAHHPIRLDDGFSDYRHPWEGTSGESDEEVIPVVKEDVHVGKRAVTSAKAYRVRSTVTEVPVEEQVRLHDETVEIERRAPTHGVTAAGDPFADKVVEVQETHEEPVVTKTPRVEEEVVVRREGHDHTETVRDTARETHVDVERDRSKKPV